MNYSSYLGSKKCCNNIICTQGEPGPRGLQGPIGPTGPAGKPSNTFTIISSQAVTNNTTVTWDINIPFIYGNQFTFTFNTIDSDIQSYIPTSSSLTTTYSYIFGTGQAVYQPYEEIISNVTVTKYGYIPTIISVIGNQYNFDFNSTINNQQNNINYQFIYYINGNTNYFANSYIQLDGTKC
jgi:hypothetical protein